MDERSHEIDSRGGSDPGQAADGALPNHVVRVLEAAAIRLPVPKADRDEGVGHVLLQARLRQEVDEQGLGPRLFSHPRVMTAVLRFCGSSSARVGAGDPRDRRERALPNLRIEAFAAAVALCSISTTARTARLRKAGSGS